METKTPIKTTPADADHFHSIFGASGAKRWRLCPGSVNVIQAAKVAGEIPEKGESEFAAEGTEAHDWAEKVLTGKAPIEEVPEDFRIHLEGYISHCKAIAERAHAAGGKVYNEASVPLFYRPQDTGTLDFAAVTPPGVTGGPGGEECPTPAQIDFVDLKYGVGVKVPAEDNDQLVIYLLSLVGMLEIDELAEFDDTTVVRLAIYQPRHFSFDGEAEVWETTLRELKDYGIDIEADYKRAKSGDETMLNPSDAACQFCDVKGICTARALKNFDPMVDFDDETAPALKVLPKSERGKATGGCLCAFSRGEKCEVCCPENYSYSDTLTPEQIAFFITNGKMMKKIIDDVTRQERARIEQGGELHGMKLVDDGGLSPKKWVDEKAAETFLKGQLSVDERYLPRKVITAPQAFGKLKTKATELSTIAKAKMGLLDEDAAKKSKTECLFHRAPKAPVLVPIDDTRPAISFKALEDEFENETQDAELDSLM